MTLPMWVTLVASAGQTMLIALVLRARHPLSLPLAALMIDLLLWNLAWVGYDLSGARGWLWLSMSVATLITPLAFESVLAFVGQRRRLAPARRAVWLYFGLASASSASRFIDPTGTFFIGRPAWRLWCVLGILAVSVTCLRLIATHRRRHLGREERAHTRIVLVAGLCGLAVGSTDLVHDHLASLPKLSNMGTLVCALGMATVVLRSAQGRRGFDLRLAVYVLGSTAVAVAGILLLFATFSPSTAMLVVRTGLLCFVVAAIFREAVVVFAARRARLAELALLGRFAAQLAHDLKNPLAALKGATQYLIERQRRDGVGDDEPFLALIEEQARRLEAIIERYARASRIDPNLGLVDLAPLLDRVARAAASAADDIEIHCDLDEPLPVCLADGELLTRALENVVQNAIDAMPTGGALTLEARAERAVGAPSVLLCVRDDGHGIDPRTSERVFDDFFTTKVSGSGLGLAFVQRVVEAHGGSVSLHSRVGRGTSVSLRVPTLA